MKRELQEQLLKLYASVEPEYRIQVSTMYVDGLARHVYEDAEGNILYNSPVFEGRNLLDVDYADVLVVKVEPDWEGIKL